MKTILLIEDNKEIRENTAEILTLSNYTVMTAENGKIGVEIAKKENPDLIICDVMMPELDGFGVLHVLSKNPSTSTIPFIFLTAKSEKEDMRKGMNLGADDYLTKPFNDLELLDAIQIRLKKNDVLKSEFQKSTEGLNEFINQVKGLDKLQNLLKDDPKKKSIAKKHSVFWEDEYPNFLYFVSKGKIKSFKIDKKGNEFITGLYKEGDFLGYIDLLENKNHSENAVALEDSEVCMIKREDFFALIENNRDVANKFIRMLSDNVTEKEERLLKLAYGSVRIRVAEALVMLQKKYRLENSKEFTISISRDDLSGIVGASKENVIRALSDFKDEKLVEISGSKITLLNPDRLINMKN